MVLAHPSLKPWIRAANAWMEAQKNIYKHNRISILESIVHDDEYMMISFCPRSVGAALAPASEGCCSEYARVRVAENRRSAFRCACPVGFFNDWFSSRRVKMYCGACLPLSSSKKTSKWMILSIVISTHRHRVCF